MTLYKAYPVYLQQLWLLHHVQTVVLHAGNQTGKIIHTWNNMVINTYCDER